MKTLVFALLALGVGLHAQQLPAGGKLVDQIMSASTAARPVDRHDADLFANELTAALRSRSLTAPQLEGVQSAIRDNLRSSGSNYAPARHLQEVLTEADVPAEQIHRVIGPFLRIGEALRGPDDPPVASTK